MTLEGLATDNQTRAEKLAGQISDAILSGLLAPGSRLDEQHLAQHFGVSRTPVREALRQLAASGLIDLRPRRGALVASVAPDELAAMLHHVTLVEDAFKEFSSMTRPGGPGA